MKRSVTRQEELFRRTAQRHCFDLRVEFQAGIAGDCSFEVLKQILDYSCTNESFAMRNGISLDKYLFTLRIKLTTKNCERRSIEPWIFSVLDSMMEGRRLNKRQNFVFTSECTPATKGESSLYEAAHNLLNNGNFSNRLERSHEIPLQRHNLALKSSRALTIWMRSWIKRNKCCCR